MLRYAVIVLVALLTCVFGTLEGAVVGSAAVRGAARASPAMNVSGNLITITNKSRAAIRRYPLQFGRPFLEGAIAHAPAVLVDGAPVPSQADVKNRYPEGSVEYAVIAAVVPSIPANGSVTLGFQDTTANSNTPLPAAQILDPSYNFDATMTLTGVAPVTVTGSNQLISANWSGQHNAGGLAGVTDAGFTITLNGTVEHVTGINLSTLAGDCSNLATLIQPHLPAGLAVASTCAVTTFTATGTGSKLSYASAPNDGSSDLSAILDLTQGSGADLAGGIISVQAPPPVATASARAMLANGDYTLWTAGPVAQTILLGDDSPARKYDLGFGDGFHPFRPRFEATFWPATHQVFIRAIGENDLSTELEDLKYTLSISAGSAEPGVVYTADLSGDQSTNPKTHPAMTVWTERFWLGGAVPDQVDVDYNLAYLDATRVIPNYDPSVNPSGAVAGEYATYWGPGTKHDLYDGAWDGGMPWQSGMGAPGDRQDIAPEPTWDVLWLYTGDWRMRDLSLGAADLAGAWSMNLRETDPTKRLLTSDPVPAAGQTGTGYGLPFSLTDRKMLSNASAGIGAFLGYAASQGAPAGTEPVIVGPLNMSPSWTSEESHQPDPFYVPYLLTGDPFYLREMENWASWSMADSNAFHTADWQGRGPTGAEGADVNELRGDAWILAHRAETAFAVPDGDPLKTYYTEQTNSSLARWEGALGITGTPFDGTAEKLWAQRTGDPETGLGNIAEPTGGPPLGNWQSQADASAIGSYINQGIWTADVATFTANWMQWFTIYAAGRVADLGFAAGALEQHTGAFLTGMINDSGYPQLIASYVFPVASVKGNFLATWPAVIADMTPTYLTSTKPNAFPGSSGQAPMPVFFANDNHATGYPANAWAAMGELANQPATTEITNASAWLKTNVYTSIGGNWGGNPSWDILPYTRTAKLPAMPTTQP